MTHSPNEKILKNQDPGSSKKSGSGEEKREAIEASLFQFWGMNFRPFEEWSFAIPKVSESVHSILFGLDEFQDPGKVFLTGSL